jgi:hypothetical protein
MAKRDVVKTSRFTSLISKGNCAAVKKTSGDTKHSVDAIQEIAYKYASQTEDLAKALIGKTIAETVQNNYNFLYSHFQYQADPRLQQMRSPICSWADRFNGIDCKSFTIFGATLLLNQGIKSMVRRIKQPSYNPNNWSHVYNAIPRDQDNLGLSKGYYIIDATKHQNIESKFIKHHDTVMSNLPHVWLNGPSEINISDNEEMNDAIESFNELLQLLADKGVSKNLIRAIYNDITKHVSRGVIPLISFKSGSILIEVESYYIGLTFGDLYVNNGLNGVIDDVGGFFDSIFSEGWSPSCIGGTYDGRDVNYVEPIVVVGFNKLYTAFNNSLLSGDIFNIQQKINDIIKYSEGFRDHTTRTAGKDWRSSCSRKATKSFKKMGDFFGEVAEIAFLNFIRKYFTFSTTTINILNVSYKDIPMDTRTSGLGLKQRDFKKNIDVLQVANLQLKGLDVPFFEFTPYLKESIENNSFNIQQLITELTNIALQFQDNGNGNGNNDEIITNPGGGVDFSPAPTQASFGIVPGLILVSAIAGGIYYSQTQNKSKTSNKNQ